MTVIGHQQRTPQILTILLWNLIERTGKYLKLKKSETLSCVVNVINHESYIVHDEQVDIFIHIYFFRKKIKYT